MKYLQHHFQQTVKHYMKISHLELPMLPEIERKFSDIIQKNKKIQRDRNSRRITPKNIAELDRNERISTSDISVVRRIFEKIKDKLFRGKS